MQGFWSCFCQHTRTRSCQVCWLVWTTLNWCFLWMFYSSYVTGSIFYKQLGTGKVLSTKWKHLFTDLAGNLENQEWELSRTYRMWVHLKSWKSLQIPGLIHQIIIVNVEWHYQHMTKFLTLTIIKQVDSRFFCMVKLYFFLPPWIWRD